MTDQHSCPSPVDLPLSGQTALVTGASRGIGRVIALTLARAGANVVVHFESDRAGAESVWRECSKYADSELAQADLASGQHVERMFTETRLLRKVDILVNNAAVAHSGLLMDLGEQEWDRIVDVNLKGPYLCSKSVIPQMVARQNGRIINISSVWGSVGASYEVAYSATKGGLNTLTKALAKELGPSGINVNAVAPGPVETDMMSVYSSEDQEHLADQTPLGRLGRPEDVASVVLFLASPASAFITGEILTVSGGY